MRVIRAEEPADDKTRVRFDASPVPAQWISHPAAPGGNDFEAIFVCRYELIFDVPAACTVRVRVSADERYVLSLDDAVIGKGPERGTVRFYHFETYDLALSAGQHRLAARVHSLGQFRPWAQESVRHAFLLLAEGMHANTLSTGVAAWTAAHLDAYESFDPKVPNAPMVVGARFRMRGDRLRKPTAAAVPTVTVGPFILSSMREESPSQWQLVASPLPAMLEQPVPAGVVRLLEQQPEGNANAASWQALLAGGSKSGNPVKIPPASHMRVLIDLQDYFCVDWRLTVRGGAGAVVRVAFAESLFEADGVSKGNRDAIDGKRFIGMGDECLCDGGETTFEPLWWLAGRYVELTIQTGAEPLEMLALDLKETRYPVTWDSDIETGDAGVASFLPLTRRAMEMCAHETFVDCPFYEQLMYAGDTRLEALVTYAFSRDDRLARKAVRLFDESRSPDGWTRSRTPAWRVQSIPPFSLWWVGMVHDLALWRNQPGEVAARMAGVRAVMEAAYTQVNGDGLYLQPTGWNFVDWVPGWDGGLPPNISNGPLGPLHFQLAYVAGLAADLEDIAGEPLLARRHRERKDRLIAAGRAVFWDAKLQLFADDREHQHHSEHTQCLAFLGGAVEAAERDAFADALVKPNNLSRTTIYFTHYLFETFRELGRIDAMFDRWKLWTGLKAAGFRTTPESPEPARSDCHAWGAHPMYHLYASVLGVRPTSAGFRTVEIAPQLGHLQAVTGKLVHPAGEIKIDARQASGKLNVSVTLPPGVSGILKINGASTKL